MLQHVWSQEMGNTSVVHLVWCMTTCTGWLFLSECSTSSLWQSIVVFATELHHTLVTDYCVPVSEVSPASAICQMPSTFSSASLPQHFWDRCIFVARPTGLLPDHLFDPAVDSNNLGGTWRYICSPDIQSVSALEVTALQLVPSYTAWWQRHTGVSSLPKATVVQWCRGRTRTKSDTLLIAPPRHPLTERGRISHLNLWGPWNAVHYPINKRRYWMLQGRRCQKAK